MGRQFETDSCERQATYLNFVQSENGLSTSSPSWFITWLISYLYLSSFAKTAIFSRVFILRNISFKFNRYIFLDFGQSNTLYRSILYVSGSSDGQ